MLSLPPRFYSNYVVKIEALTILLTSLSLLSHTQAHTHTHTHTQARKHTPVCPSVGSWAELRWHHAPCPCQWLLSDWVIEWSWVNQPFLGTFQLQLPLSALWNRNWEKWDSELPASWGCGAPEQPHLSTKQGWEGSGAPWLPPRPCSSSSWALLPPGPSYALVMWPNTFLFCLSWLTLSFYPSQPGGCWPL